MARRRSGRTELLDWWRTVLEETRETVGGGFERRRQVENAAWANELAALREMFGGVTAKADGVASTGGGTSPKSSR